MSLILNQAQAEAVYSAMCALNNVGHTFLRANFEAPHGRRINVSETCEGVAVRLHAYQGNPVEQIESGEDYDDQSAFATAYGLISDEPQSAVAAAAGGLTQTAIER